MKLNNYDAYLFDFDFTLANALPGIVISYNHAFKVYGLPEQDELTIKNTVGLTVINSFMLMNKNVTMELAKKLRAEFDKTADKMMNANTSFLPGSVELLERLKRNEKKIGVVTTKYAYRIKDFFESQGLANYLSLIIGGSDVSKHKPDPEGLIKAGDILKEKYGIDKKRIIYIGDSYVDAMAANAAQMDFAAVTTGTTPGEYFTKYNPLTICENITCLRNKLFPERNIK